MFLPLIYPVWRSDPIRNRIRVNSNRIRQAALIYPGSSFFEGWIRFQLFSWISDSYPGQLHPDPPSCLDLSRIRLLLKVGSGSSYFLAHVTSNLSYLICLSIWLSISRVVTNWIDLLRKDLFHFMRAQHVLCYHLI